MQKAIFSVFFAIFVLFAFPVHADEKTETCRSYIVDLLINKKYCLFDADERIAGLDRQTQENKQLDAFKKSQEGGSVPSEQSNSQ